MNRVFRALVANDLRLFFSDKRALVATIFVPILIASFFAMIFGGGSDAKKATIAVLVADADQSKVSRKIIEGLRIEGSFTLTPASEEAARAAVGRGKASVALVIPKDFGKQSASAMFNPLAPRPKLTFLYDPAHNADLQMARGLMTQQVMQVVSQEAFSNPEVSGIGDALKLAEADTSRDPQEKSALTEMLRSVQKWQSRPPKAAESADSSPGMGMSNPCEMESEAVVAKKPNEPKDASGGKAGATHVFIGMGVQGLLFFAIDFAIGMVRDRRLGLWKRLRAAPISRLMLLGSRWISSTLIGLVVLCAVLAFGAMLYGIRVNGSTVGFLLLAVASSLMVAAFGLLIAALGRTEGQCRAFAVPAVLTMSFLGGAWIPTFMMPAWVQPISQLLPTRWAVDGFDLVTWRGLGLVDTLPSLGVVLLFAFIFAGFALTRFRWEE
ncbi:ABC transporter permease [Armatimonas sp.]|uniref:ABC transporter permease n=1 Tax=Armatimonas sp. TaxID=1872638 RepID=UPI003752E9CF